MHCPRAASLLMIFNSWKEIAQYMGRAVRTLQRWEHDLGLPVHRPKGKDRSAVLAFAEELDTWLHRTPLRGHERTADRQDQHSRGVRGNSGNSHEVRVRTASLSSALVQICVQGKEATTKLIDLLHQAAEKAAPRNHH
jgi:hypothetical protein